MTLDELKEKIINVELFEVIDIISAVDNGTIEFGDEVWAWLDSDECERLLKNTIFNNIDILISDTRINQEEYSDVFDMIVQYAKPDTIIEFLKMDIDLIKILRKSEFDYELSDIQSLSENDRELFTEKLGAYLPISIQEQLMPDKNREELIYDKKEVIVQLWESDNERGARTQIKGMNEDEIIKVMEEFDGYSIVELTKGMNDENRVKLIEISKSKFDLDMIINLVNEMKDEENKIKFIEKNDKELGVSGIVGIALGMTDAGKIKLINIILDSFYDELYNIADIVKEMSEENKLKVIENYFKKMEGWHLANIAEEMTEENKLKVIEIAIDRLASRDIARIARGMSEENKLKVIENYFKKMEGWHLADITKEMSEENKLKVIENYFKKMEGWHLANIAEEMTEENKLKVIEIAIDRLESGDIVRIAIGLSNENKLKVIEIASYKLTGEDIAKIVIGMEDKNKIEIISKYKILLNNKDLGEILSDFSSLNSQNEEYLREYLENENFETDNLKFSLKILNGLGTKVFNPANAQLTSNKAMEVIGEETIYDLFKYYIFNDENIEIDKILENPELFSKYEEFRKTFIEQKQMGVMNKKGEISEFNGNSELIRDCIDTELTPEEIKLLQATLKEDKVELTSKEDLRNFPEKRREVIENLIETNTEEAIIYMLAGMSVNEYKEKIKQYINDEALNSMLSDINEIAPELGIIKATNEFIKLIMGINIKNRQQILRLYNNDLANEFTEKGSIVANMRSSFKDIEIKIRKVYGKELSSALKKDKLPESEIDEIDKEIKVIKLQGEKFKLLIHGIDAYGKGSGKFEKREVGKSYICTSLISEKHMERARAGRYYGFIDIEENALIEESDQNMYSYAGDETNENSTKVSSHLGSKFLTSEKMIEESKGFNEIVLWREYIGNDGQNKEVWPSYIVCFNDINDGDREEAKRLGIPIVLIDEKAYAKKIEEKKNKADEKVETSEIEMPKEYGETKFSMMDVLKDASNYCSAHAQQEALQKIVTEMERQLEVEKDMVH